MTAFGFAVQRMDTNQSKPNSTTLAQAVLPTGFKQLPFNNAIGDACNYAYSGTKTLLVTSQYLSKSISDLGRGLFSARTSKKRARSADSEDDETCSGYATKRCRSSNTDMMDMDEGFFEAAREAQMSEHKRTAHPQSVWWTEPFYG